MTVKLLTKQHFEFLSLKEGCNGLYVYFCINATLLVFPRQGAYILPHQIGIFVVFTNMRYFYLTQPYQPLGKIKTNSRTSLQITVCHHSASLVMPKGDHLDRFFIPSSHS